MTPWWYALALGVAAVGVPAWLVLGLFEIASMHREVDRLHGAQSDQPADSSKVDT